MKREILTVLLLALLLSGCGDTTVYLPEEAIDPTGTLIQIPVKPTEETESAPTDVTESTVPETTEPEPETTAPTETKPSNKGSSGNKGGGSSKPAQTHPPATEPPPTEPPLAEPVATEPPLYDISGYVVGSLEYEMLERINGYRTEEGLDLLSLDAYLCAIASCRSYEVSSLWSHTRPDGRGYESVLADYGYGGGAAGELLGYAAGDGAAIVDKWMASESHRALLMGGSSVIGIGIYYADGVAYVTCLLVG